MHNDENNTILSKFKEDTKFASKYEIDILNKLTNKNFNYDDLILLEKLAGDDYRKRVYLDENTQIGTIEFDLLDLEWKFTPSPYYYYLENPKLKLVPTKRRLKGKYLKEEYIENIEEYNNIVENTDYFVGIDMGKFLGVGIKRDNRIKVKDLQKKNDEIRIKKITNYLQDNKERINKLVQHSKDILVEYIQKYENKNYVINVSFSGGKDSAVSTLLATEIMEDMDVLFIDTGLEYPETNQYVKDFAKKYDLNLHTIDGDNFWDEVDEEGIPTKEDRWCNSTCKLIPLEEFFEENYPNKKILTIDGSRKLESFARANLEYTRQSGFIDAQTNLFPILDWNSIDIWSYIFLNDVLYNPMYEEGFERIGCYMCPSALNSEFLRVKELHPKLWDKWADQLRKENYDNDEILRGFWRWDELPPKMRELKRNLQYKGRDINE